jgi:DNA modification methylase/DNA-directed RNA polymerase subunit RPC12/RpoP
MSSLDQQNDFDDFLARHVKQYDPATDDYDRPPFTTDVISPGRSSRYNFHYYLTKVPPEAIVPLLDHFTQPGDVVLDPFCGSGMTGVAIDFVNFADEREQRYCVLSDLSPAACHIARNYTLQPSPDQVRHECDRITVSLEKDCDRLYSTAHFEPLTDLYARDAPLVSRHLRHTGEGNPEPSSLIASDPEIPWEPVSTKTVNEYLGFLPSNSRSEGTACSWLKIPAMLLYVVWSDVYKCEGFKAIDVPTSRVNPRTGKVVLKKARVVRGCGKEILARGTNDKQEDDGNNSFLRCPHCGERWMKGRLRRINIVPVEEHYEYLGIAIVKGAPTQKLLRAARPVSSAQLAHIESLSHEALPVSAPNPPVDKNNPRYRRDSLAGKKIETYKDFFTHRNYWALALIWNEISKAATTVQSALRFCFTSQVMRCSRLRRMKGDKPGEQLSGTLHIASETVETNVFKLFRQATMNYCELISAPASREVVDPFVRIGSATELSGIPDASIDYIFTDPPFGSNIYYSGVNFMWEAWLGEFTDEPLEAVMHRTVDGGYKRIDDYAILMNESFKEMFRVLKPGRFATVEFNNSDGEVFQVIRNGLVNAGFQIQNMLLFDKVERTYAQIRSNIGISEVVDKDVLFNLRKPAIVRPEVRAEDRDLEPQLVEAVRQHLESLPERIKTDSAKYSDEHRTTATINSMLMNTLIPRGVSVERLNLPFIERVCGRYFRKVGQRWYLRGEAVGGNVGDRLFASEVAIGDEITAIDWLRQELHARSMLLGELKPLWMKATGLLPSELSQTLVLEDLLTENFWRDAESNRWREPTPDERERMNDDRSLRVLHDAERFVSGVLRRETTDEERSEWIDVLFQACRAIEDNEMDALPALRGFDKMTGYALIPRLFQSILRDHVEPNAYARSEKQVRVASQRIQNQLQGEQPSKANSKMKVNTNQGTLDFKKAT